MSIGKGHERLAYYLYLIRRNRLFILGMVIVGCLTIAAILAPWIAPYPGDLTGNLDLKMKLKSPSGDHLMGTDVLGRDVLTRVMYGGRNSLTAGLGVVILSLCIGTPLGLIAGYFKGWSDEVIMRTADGFISFPPLLLPMIMGAAFGTGLTVNMVALGLSWWPAYVRLIRAQVLVVREQLFVAAAKSMGVKDRMIILRHILPNIMGPILVNSSLDMGYAILASASLSFIGIGARPPTAEWGLMIAESRAYFLDYWWSVTFPGLTIFIAVIGFSLLGDGLRDILDPKVR